MQINSKTPNYTHLKNTSYFDAKTLYFFNKLKKTWQVADNYFQRLDVFLDFDDDTHQESTMIRKILLSMLLVLSPVAAMAGMASGEINISLTILPTCQVSVANAQPSVSCAQHSFSQPRISESQLEAIPGISLGSKLVTIEW